MKQITAIIRKGRCHPGANQDNTKLFTNLQGMGMGISRRGGQEIIQPDVFCQF
jgi:hypothetical protein